MLKRVLIILTTFVIFTLQAQESLNLKVTYVMEINQYNTYKISPNPKVDCILYIQDGESKFDMYYEQAYKKYPGEVYNYHTSIDKNFNKNEMYGRVLGYKGGEYVIKDSLNIIDWKLQDSIKIINGRTCKLAVTKWRDHDWEAWYDESIPISDGPFKLHGLPGLILEAKTKDCSKSESYFILNSIEFTNNSLKKNIYFPYIDKEFKFIDYDSMYKDESQSTINYLKDSYLKSEEYNAKSNNNITNGSSCISSLSFDYCFCYPIINTFEII